jgi:hypothetical protein
MTELIWDGNYVDGKKVAPVRIALPFQTIETVNKSAKDRQRTLDLFAADREPAWRSRLICGDKKYVIGFGIEYTNPKMNLRSYYPDSVAIAQGATRWLMETKGAETTEVARRDEAAQRWCEDATELTGVRWRYLKVPQKQFEQLQAATLADLVALQAA